MLVRPSFQGLPNYRRFYNKEVHEFFSTVRTNYPTAKKSPSEGNFTLSIISQNGDLSYVERKERRKLRVSQSNEDGGVPESSAELNLKGKGNSSPIVEGTVWSAHEKEVFFSLLARYLIHRVDLIVDQLPSKSTIEVLNYYHLLKNELRALKTKFRGSPSHVYKCKVIMNHNQQPIIHDYKIKKPYNSLCSMKHIPIAHEMSLRFIAMEEIQAKLMMDKAVKFSNDFHKKFMVDMDNYDKDASTLMIRRKGKIQGKGSIGNMSQQNRDTTAGNNAKLGPIRYSLQLSPIELEVPPADSFSQESLLIDIDNCHRISQRMYREFYGPHTSKQFIKVHYPPITLLDKLVRLYTSEIILKLLDSKAIKEWVTGSSVATSEFTLADIYRIVGKPTKKTQFLAEQKTESKTSIKVGKSRRSKNVTEANENSVLADESEKDSGSDEERSSTQESDVDSDPIPHEIIIEECDDEGRTFDDVYLPTPPTGGPLHISQLPQSRRSTENRMETSINKLITKSLHSKEAEMLDKWDKQESMNYEHILLTALTTYREGEQEVESSMYDIDTAFEMIEDEQIGELESDSETEEAKTHDAGDAKVEIDDKMLVDFTYIFPIY